MRFAYRAHTILAMCVYVCVCMHVYVYFCVLTARLAYLIAADGLFSDAAKMQRAITLWSQTSNTLFAQLNLCAAYSEGWGVKKDEKEAQRFLAMVLYCFV